MSDYIKREDAIRKIVNKAVTEQLDSEAIGKVIRILTDIDKTDVRENVKGKWIIKTDGFVIKRVWGVCSECGNTLDFSGVNAGRGDANFCPNCGADMRGDQT